MGSPPSRTDHFVACLLGYVSSEENAVARAARASKAHPVLSGVGLQQCIIGFAAGGERHMPVVVGPEGSGKSFLLTALARRSRELFPLLPVHATFRTPGTAGRVRAVAFLRALARAHGEGGDLEALSPNEVLHNGPALLQRLGARAAGLVLLVDDLLDVCGGDLPCWLPLPLPPGLHCVATLRGRPTVDAAAIAAQLGIQAVSSVVIRRLGDLYPRERVAVSTELAPAHAPLATSAMFELAAAGCTMAPRACCLLAHLVALEPTQWRRRLREAARLLQEADRQSPLPPPLLEEAEGAEAEGGPATGELATDTEADATTPLAGAEEGLRSWVADLRRPGGGRPAPESAGTSAPPDDDADPPWDVQGALALAILQVCERRCGAGAKETFAYLAHASHGLSLSELTALRAGGSGLPASPTPSQATEGTGSIDGELEFCAPLLRDVGSMSVAVAEASGNAATDVAASLVALGGDFAVRACEAFCREGPVTAQIAKQRLAAYFAAAAAHGEGMPRTLEAAAAQFAAMDLKGEAVVNMFMGFVTRLAVLEHFSTRPDELVRLWQRAEAGCSGVGEQLLLEAKVSAWSPEALALAGRLLSLAGVFAAARGLLQRAADGFAAVRGGERGRAEALVLLAHNEVRYWDSRRDWRGVAPLQLLLDSSAEAILLLRQGQIRGPEDRQWLARALSRRANGCFKAGCVLPPGNAEQERYFDESDSCTAEAMELLRGQRLQILGECVLVGGVTTLCRAHSRRRRQQPNLELAHRAMTQFYHAESILRLAVGPMNEMSIYTHGNLAELFLQDLGEMYLGLLHYRQSAVVATRVFGAQHTNASRKLRELEDLMMQLGWNGWRELVRAGRPEEVSPRDIARRLEAMNLRLWSVHAGQLAQVLRDAGHSRAGFWPALWRDLGVPEEMLAQINLPT